MKNIAIKKISPLALGIMVFSYPIIQGSTAYGASLKNAVAADEQLLNPGLPALQSSPPSGSVGCALSPAGSGTVLPNVTGSANAGTQAVASSATGSVVPATVAANAPAFDNAAPSTVPDSASSTLIAQASLGDCCEIGGTTTCEVGGLPPAGGGILGGGPSPLLALLGLPAALIPAFLGGGDSSNSNPTPTPVPESSSTGAIAAGFSLLGLWYGRRYHNARKTCS